MWNASVAKQLFKNNRGEIKLSVYDMLNQNTSFNRFVGDGLYRGCTEHGFKQVFSSFIYL
jgi:hypothetical protein